MRKIIVMILTLLCCATLCFGGLAANPPAKLGLNEIKQSGSGSNAPASNSPAKASTATASVSLGNITILRQDSGTNLTEMNIAFTISPTYGSSQAVKFTAPKSGWKLQNVLVMATDNWNASSKQLPNVLPFAIEIRDANLRLLYHFSDIQLPYFTAGQGVRMANIEVPSITVNGDFLVCFYGYRSIGLATEMQNATGNSYYFDKVTGQIYNAVVPINNNQTRAVNWLIRVAGE